jgi:hypothetical protein
MTKINPHEPFCFRLRASDFFIFSIRAMSGSGKPSRRRFTTGFQKQPLLQTSPWLLTHLPSGKLIRKLG